MLSTVNSKPPAALAAFAGAGGGAPARGTVAAIKARPANPEARRTEMCMEKYTIAVNRTSLPTVYSSEPRSNFAFFLMEPFPMRLYQPIRARIATFTAVLATMSLSAFGQPVSGSGQGTPPSLNLAVRPIHAARSLQNRLTRLSPVSHELLKTPFG